MAKNDKLPEETKIGKKVFVLCEKHSIYYLKPKKTKRDPDDIRIPMPDCPVCIRQTILSFSRVVPTCSMGPRSRRSGERLHLSERDGEPLISLKKP